MVMKLVLVVENLINITSKFAQDVFIDYYTSLIGEKQANYMADLFLSPRSIEKLINDGAIFKLAIENDKIVGFTEYKLEDNRVFLSKLYVRKDKRHLGIGKIMVNDCIAYAKQNGINKIYLTVNKGNTPSINIYEHLGFKKIDDVISDIGNNYIMDDYIYQLNII